MSEGQKFLLKIKKTINILALSQQKSQVLISLQIVAIETKTNLLVLRLRLRLFWQNLKMMAKVIEVP